MDYFILIVGILIGFVIGIFTKWIIKFYKFVKKESLENSTKGV